MIKQSSLRTGSVATKTGNPPATGRINRGSAGMSGEAEAVCLTTERCGTSLAHTPTTYIHSL